MYSIMTMGGSEMVVGVLNAVAAAVGEDSFHSLLRLGVLFGYEHEVVEQEHRNKPG